MIHVDVTEPLLDYSGEPIVRDGRVLTLRDCIAEVLQAQDPTTQTPPGKESLARCFGLTSRVYASPKVEFDAEDVNFILQWSARVNFNALWDGRLHEALDPPVTPPEDEVTGDGE